MKAIVAQQPFGPDSIVIEERPEPGAPLPHQVLLRVTATALNYRDLLVGRGHGRWAPPSGRILGSDAAGVVVEVGSDVVGLSPGDRVISSFLPNWIDGPANKENATGALGGAAADGVFAEYVLLDGRSLVRTPSHMADIEAATLVCAGVTSWHALQKADSLHPGRTVLVQGTGGVSILALQIATMAGARVIATSSSDRKLEIARELGAVDTINYKADPRWAQTARRLTNDVGVEHILDVGGAATLNDSITAAAYEGTVSLIGLLGGLQASLDVSSVFLRNIRLQGIETGSRAMLNDLARWSEKAGFRPKVANSYPLDDARQAFDQLANQETVGKIALSFG